jgi:hypothetical protein
VPPTTHGHDAKEVPPLAPKPQLCITLVFAIQFDINPADRAVKPMRESGQPKLQIPAFLRIRGKRQITRVRFRF